MKASVERLRWLLAGAAVVLLVVLVGFLSYGRYKAAKTWQNLMKHAGVHITHETDGFTYSQSLQGRTAFTLHAAKAIQHEDDKWSLHDVVVTLYSKTTTGVDHIYASDIEYDNVTGVATVVGEVNMDLQAPGALAAGGAHLQHPATGTPVAVQPAAGGDAKKSAGDDDHIIHIRTSGLVYVRKLAVAATDQQVEFRYAGMQCVAKGAEFDSGESFLHLLANVVLTGDVNGSPMTVHAVKADLDRQSNTVALIQPVAESQGRTAKAASALIHLRNDGSVERGEASGGVSVDAGTRHITAASFAGTFNGASLPQTSKLTGGVVVIDTDTARPLRAQASEMDATFNALGNPVSVLAIDGAQVAFTDHKPGTPDLTREIRGDRVLSTFKPEVRAGARKAISRVSEIHAMGSAMVRGDSLVKTADNHGAAHAPELKSTQMSSDDLRAEFDPGVQSSELKQVFGIGHTRLEQDSPGGEKQTSSADNTEIEFATRPGSTGGQSGSGLDDGLQISSATQSGHVMIHSRAAVKAGASAPKPDSDASAARAVYEGATQKLTLTGAARFTQGDTSLTATSITLDQQTGDADAVGSVLATMAGTPGTLAPGVGAKPVGPTTQVAAAAMTHVSADRAHLVHATQLAEFRSTDAHPAKLWQGASQVQAATLLFDQKRRSLEARPAAAGGLVHAVFASDSQASGKGVAANGGVKHVVGVGSNAGQVVGVASASMDYDDVNREATFTGGVRVDGTTGQARSQRGVVFLNPATVAGSAAGAGKPAEAMGSGAGQPTPFGGSVREIVLSGDVWISQPGRTGTGEQLVYTAADASYIFTGTPAKPPHMVDAQQGNVTGATLVFHSGKDASDSTIVVAGAPVAAGSSKAQHGRVRTETEVKQGGTEVRQ
jgi:lipopolysaccharide export system protein LptA